MYLSGIVIVMSRNYELKMVASRWQENSQVCKNKKKLCSGKIGKT